MGPGFYPDPIYIYIHVSKNTGCAMSLLLPLHIYIHTSGICIYMSMLYQWPKTRKPQVEPLRSPQ